MASLQPVHNNRNGAADLLKGIAVVLMIQVHIMEQFATADLYNSTIGKLSLFLGGPACAPAFMAAMGYYLAQSKRTPAGILKRGIMLFSGGILLNTGRSVNLLAMIFSGEVSLNPWHFILGADILTLAGISVIIIGLLRYLSTASRLLYTLMLLSVVVLSVIVPEIPGNSGFSPYVSAFFWGGAAWSYFPLFPWLSYVLAGYAFNLFQHVKFIKKYDLKQSIFAIIPAWLFILATLPWAAGITCNLSGAGGYYHHGILFIIWTLVFLLSYLPILQVIDSEYGGRRITLLIKWMGRRVTILYVIQWLIIGNLAAVLFRSQHMFQVAAWVAGVTIATCLGGFLYPRLRSAFSGKP